MASPEYIGPRMNFSVDRAKSVGQDVIGEIKAENVTFMAGSIAYQAFVSLIPLLALVFILAAVLGDQGLAQTLTDYTESVFPPQLQTLISNYITSDAGGSASAGIIGLVTLVWGTLKIFRGLDTAFSEIYDTDEQNSIVDQVKDGLVVLGAVGVALIAAVVATTVFALFPNVPYIGLLSPLFLVVGLAIAFFPMYYLFPDVEIQSYKQVLPGVAVAAVGWALLQSLFQLYLAFTGGAAQDVVGAIVLLLTWLYFGGLLLLIGAVVNAVINDEANLDEDTAERSAADERTGEDATPTARSSSELSFDPDDEPADSGDVAARSEEIDERERQLTAEEERLREERESLAEERGELEQRRTELEATAAAAERDSRGGESTASVLAENRELRRRLRWAEKPRWKRTVWRLLGRRPRWESE